ncbi:hypothetical protein GWK47_045397 [Chionoecetes opilio]|uniref:Uncharacterized protein n=1 Tax=Chionoecetes opilio TaxID=41210 RepID=A0A8J4YCY2_CHIOP|nr:hypothetical protein GWK47_045397 [Chionoecetes opilio]
MNAIVGRAAPLPPSSPAAGVVASRATQPAPAKQPRAVQQAETRPGWVRGPRPSHHPTSPAWTKLPSRHTSSCPGGTSEGSHRAWAVSGRSCHVFVAAMEEPCLRGMDYLSQCEALVVFRSQMLKNDEIVWTITLRVRGEEVPLLPVSAAESVINPEVKHAALWTGNRVQCMLSREGQESDVTTTGGEQRQDGGVMSEQPGSGGAAVTGLPEYLEDLARRSAVCLTEAQTPPGRAWLHTL